MNKQLKNLIDSAVLAYNKGREKLHMAAVACVAHAFEHGDIMPIHYLLETMGTRSQTRHRIAAWVRHHGGTDVDGKRVQVITANIKQDGTITVKIAEKDKRDGFDQAPFAAQPYWEVVDVQQAKAAYELEKAILSMVNRALKEEKTPEEIRKVFSKVLKKAAA